MAIVHLDDGFYPNRMSYSIYEFSAQEIDQMVGLVRWYCSGVARPWDRKRQPLSPDVIRWGISVGLVQWDRPSHPRRRLVLAPTGASNRFDPRYALPPEALWRLVDPIIGDRTGFSIAYQDGWLSLNIWPEGGSFAGVDSLEAKIELLNLLATWGYIHFQYLANIWQVTRR
jgi:hypothetical protein